jgi:hypothetical protein
VSSRAEPPTLDRARSSARSPRPPATGWPSPLAPPLEAPQRDLQPRRSRAQRRTPEQSRPVPWQRLRPWTQEQRQRQAWRPALVQAQLAKGARSTDRRTPGDRSLGGRRSTRRAPWSPPPRSARPSLRLSLLPGAHRARPRSSRDGRAWRYSRARSRSRPSCRRSAPSLRTTRFPPPERGRDCRWEPRDPRRDAGQLRKGARGRT